MPAILFIHLWRTILMAFFCIAYLHLCVNSADLSTGSSSLYTPRQQKTASRQNISKYSNFLMPYTKGWTRKKWLIPESRKLFTNQTWKAENDNRKLLKERSPRILSFRLDSFSTKTSASLRTCNFTTKPDGLRADCSGQELKRVPMDLPTSITELSLFHNKIAYLPARVFIKYPCLRSLNLSFNLISELVNDSFKGLSKLKSLDLSYNKLHLHNCSQVCCNNPFKPLRNLTRLNMKLKLLDHHKPLTLHGCLIDLPNLEDLAISVSDNFTFGPEFWKLKNLKYLNMSESYMLTHVSKDFFTNLSKCPLRNLSLTSCNLFTIHPKSLQNLTQLEMLDLSNNTNLGLLNATRCVQGAHNSSLRVLHLDRLLDPTLRDSVIVKEEFFKPLSATNLTQLHIEWNSIVKIEESALEKLPVTLEILSVRNNRLTDPYRFLKPLLRLVNLRRLDARGQGAFIPPEKESFGNLSVKGKQYGNNETENIWNHLEREPLNISVPPKLEEVLLTHANSFAPVLNGVVTFVNSSIKRLTLNNNNLQRFSAIISGLSKVEILDLTYNDLNVQVGFFNGFSGLRYLFLTRNCLNESIAADHDGHMFENLTYLEQIHLGKNGISRLFPKLFRKNYRLRKIVLYDNKLTALGCRISHLKYLTKLNLSRNSMTYLDKFAMEDLLYIARYSQVSVDLSLNPLVCSCDSLDFLKWTSFLHSNITLTNIDKMQCLAQNGSTYISLSRRREIVKDLQIRCRSYTGLIVGFSLAILTSVLVVVVGLVYRYRWKLRYVYHIRLLRRFIRLPKFSTKLGYIPISGDDSEDTFDVFVAYADEDRRFVIGDMRQVLEDGNGFKMYIRDRDSIAGMEIATNIIRAVNQSRLTILLLSRNFIQSKWCIYEFQMARIEGVVRRENIILYVMCEDINCTEMPGDLMKGMQHGKLVERPCRPENRQNMCTFWTMLLQGIRKHNV